MERNQGGGIGVNADGLVQNCIAMNNGLGGSGANIAGGGGVGYCRIIGNQIKYGPTGLLLTGTDNVVSDNFVQGCTDNYNFSAGNQLNLLICEIPEILEWPCVAKLAGSLTYPGWGSHGIRVNAVDVTIDLDGHTLMGPGTTGGPVGIYQQAYRNLTVKNGKVVNWNGENSGGITALGDSALIVPYTVR